MGISHVANLENISANSLGSTPEIAYKFTQVTDCASLLRPRYCRRGEKALRFLGGTETKTGDNSFNFNSRGIRRSDRNANPVRAVWLWGRSESVCSGRMTKAGGHFLILTSGLNIHSRWSSEAMSLPSSILFCLVF